MEKKLIDVIESKVYYLEIQDNNPVTIEACKNLYRALLIVAYCEKPRINDLTKVIGDDNLTIYLLNKFDYLNKNVFLGLLSHIVLDTSNQGELKKLIYILKKSLEKDNAKRTVNKFKSLKIINTNTYPTDAEFRNDYDKINKEDAILSIGNWWGEGSFGMSGIIISKDKDVYKYYSCKVYEESPPVTEYEIKIYEKISDEELNNLMKTIENYLSDETENDNIVFDGGNSISINYGGIKKKFSNIDINKHIKINNIVEELIID